MTEPKHPGALGGVLSSAALEAGRTGLFVSALLALAACPGDDTTPIEDTEGTTGETSTTADGTTTTGVTPVDSSSTEAADTTNVPMCGNGIVEADEVCDDMGESADCNEDCTASSCGDGIVNAVAGEECDDQGESETCTETCVMSVCGDGVVNASADEECDDRGETETCDIDCTAPACGDGVRNATVGEECDDGNDEVFDFCDDECTSAPAVVLDSMHMLDTDTGELDGEPLTTWDPANAIWYLTGFELTADAELLVVGTAPLTLEVQGDVLVAGLIDLSGGDGGGPTGPSCSVAGEGGMPGPGGFAGGAGAGNGGSGTEDGEPGAGPGMAPAEGGVSSTVNSGSFGAGGGGGGGHLVAGSGGQGNNGGAGGAGGELHDSLPPLIGGGGGGGGGVEKDAMFGAGLDPGDDEGTGGGGGGGAVHINASVSITVTGTIDASGGDGGNDQGCPENPGHGGGGAGGAIQLTSPAVDVMGVLNVSGGQGGVPTFNIPGGAELIVGGDGADGNVVQ